MGAWRYTPPGRPINFLTWPRRCAKARASPTSAASTSRKPRPSTIPIFKSRSNGQPESRQMAYGWLHASDLHQSAISASTSGSTQLLSRPRRPPQTVKSGPRFMISLVPEGTQIPSGYPSYGGQFGSYLAITYAIGDMLSFIDVQSYNTPPLEGLDGEIYQPGTVDYPAAMTELLLHGFNVGGDPKQFFPPVPADKVAVGFLTGDTTPEIVSQAMDYIITGKAPAGTKYKLREPTGYPGMIGAMFWTIDADRRGNHNFSNAIGPQLHGYPATK